MSYLCFHCLKIIYLTPALFVQSLKQSYLCGMQHLVLFHEIKFSSYESGEPRFSSNFPDDRIINFYRNGGKSHLVTLKDTLGTLLFKTNAIWSLYPMWKRRRIFLPIWKGVWHASSVLTAPWLEATSYGDTCQGSPHYTNICELILKCKTNCDSPHPWIACYNLLLSTIPQWLTYV